MSFYRERSGNGGQMIEEPESYQQFFASLEKAMFITAHPVD